MAARVNTKFLLILGGAVAMAGAIIGGMWFMQYRGDTSRNIRAGDAAMERGEFEAARAHYGRAVAKQPGMLEFVDKLEAATLQVVPATQEKTIELYEAWLGILKHRTRHNPESAEAHVALIEQLIHRARMYGLDGRSPIWKEIAQSADDMYNQLREDDPRRVEALLYRGMATTRQARSLTIEDAAKGEVDLQAFLAAQPASDEGWAALIRGRMELSDAMSLAGQPASTIQKQEQLVDEAVEKGLAAVPQGIEVAQAAAIRLARVRQLRPQAVAPEQVDQAAQRIVDRCTPDEKPGVLTACVDGLLSLGGQANIQRAIQIVERALEAHPEELDKRLILARLRYMNEDFDGAEEAAQQVLSTGPLKTGLLATMRESLRISAAAVQADLAHQRFLRAEDAAKPAFLTKLEQAVAELRTLVTNDEDPAIMRSEGKLAHSKGDYRAASAKFEKLVVASNGDYESLLYAADSLERIGEAGLAYERTSAALERQPGNQRLIADKARLETKLNMFDEAARTLSALSPEALEQPDIKELAEAIRNQAQYTRQRLEGTEEVTDPIAKAGREANRKLAEGDMDGARAELEAALAGAPDHVGLLELLTRFELSAGDNDKAADYLRRAMTLAPDNVRLKTLKTMLDTGDPIASLKQAIELQVADELERKVAMAINLRAMARQQLAQANALAETDPERSASARALSERAQGEAAKALEIAVAAKPDDARLIEHVFHNALEAKDWNRAEQQVAKLKTANADQAGGLFFQGQLERARGDIGQAVRTFELAADRAGFSSRIWRELGLTYTMLGNLAQAQRAHEAAYQRNPNDLPTVREYLGILLRRGEMTRALRVVQTARAIAPADLQLRETWMELEEQAGNAALVLRERRRLYQQTPADRVNARRLAQFLGTKEPSRVMLTDDSGKELYSAERWERMSIDERNRVMAEATTQWRTQATTILDAVASSGGDDLALAVARARLLRAQGDDLAGERVLRDFIARQPEGSVTSQMFIALGNYQGEGAHYTEAIATLKEALPLQSATGREIDRALGNLYYVTQQYEEAVTYLDEVAKATNDIAVKQQIIECLIKGKRFQDARTKLDQLVADNRGDAVTAMLESTILEGQGDELLASGDASGASVRYADSKAAIARAEQLEPTSPMPPIMRAQFLLREYGRTRNATLIDDALLALDKAEKNRAGTIEAGLTRVSAFVMKNDRASAVSELQRILARAPENFGIRQQLVAMQVQMRMIDAAVATLRDGIRLRPRSPELHSALADLLGSEVKDADGAAASYLTAYELAPSGVAMIRYVDSALRVRAPEYRRLVAMIEGKPEWLESFPYMRSLYVKALVGDKKRDQAMTQLRTAYAQYRKALVEKTIQPSAYGGFFDGVLAAFGADKPAEIEAFIMDVSQGRPDVTETRWLGSLWSSQGESGVSRALELTAKALEMSPPEEHEFRAALHMEIGNLHVRQQMWAEAVRSYEAAVGENPNMPEALNNLGYILADILNQPAKAVEYAEKAHAIVPNDPAIMDTLGWAHFRAGNLEKARDLLERSLRIADVAGTRIHIAEVMIAQGLLDDAGRMLGRAIALKPDAASMTEIERLRADIEKRRQGR